jgi:hypothetical protein
LQVQQAQIPLVNVEGGKTLPVIVNLYPCIPIQALSIRLAYTGAEKNNFRLNEGLSKTVYDNSTVDTRLFFVLEQLQQNILTENTSYPVTIQFNQSSYYKSITVQIRLVSAQTLNITQKPQASKPTKVE